MSTRRFAGSASLLSSACLAGGELRMKRASVQFLFLVAIASGCGPSATELREQTVSVLNTESDRWDGGQVFTTTAKDAYGHSLSSHVEKKTLSYVLEVRSHGPD